MPVTVTVGLVVPQSSPQVLQLLRRASLPSMPAAAATVAAFWAACEKLSCKSASRSVKDRVSEGVTVSMLLLLLLLYRWATQHIRASTRDSGRAGTGECRTWLLPCAVAGCACFAALLLIGAVAPSMVGMPWGACPANRCMPQVRGCLQRPEHARNA